MGKTLAMAQAMQGAKNLDDVKLNFENMTDASQMNFRELVSGDLSRYTSYGEGLNSKDAKAAANRGGGGFDPFGLARFANPETQAGMEHEKINYAEETEAQRAAMARFTDAVDEASVAVSKLTRSFAWSW
jgi:hypothetical protein